MAPTLRETTNAPFHRFYLTEHLRLPPTTPKDVNSETWAEFWESLKPFITKVQRKDKLTFCISITVCLGLFATTLLWEFCQWQVTNDKAWDDSFLPVFAFVAVASVLSHVYGMIVRYIKLCNIENLKKF